MERRLRPPSQGRASRPDYCKTAVPHATLVPILFDAG
jgi:hypothetical protein